MEYEPIVEESRSITDYFKPTKREIIEQKKQRKVKQQKSVRKNSMQLSISGWLKKPRPKQPAKIIQLPKNMVMTILGYLKISEIINVGQTCFYLNQCAKTIWNDTEFLGQLETDQLSYQQLYLIFHKSGRLGHIKQLRNIYRGKNLKSCRQKIKLKIGKSNTHSLNPIVGTLLQVFEVSPKTAKSSTFIMDNHLQQVVNSSFRSLTQIKLISCGCLRKFDLISKCTQLTRVSITNNCFLSSDNLRLICKCCEKIKYLDVSGCQYLDQNMFKHFQKLKNLETLRISNYNQPFIGIQALSNLTHLKNMSIENCCIMDVQAIQLVSSIKSLENFNISGCRLLTDAFLQWMISNKKKITVEFSRTELNGQMIQKYKQQQRQQQ